MLICKHAKLGWWTWKTLFLHNVSMLLLWWALQLPTWLSTLNLKGVLALDISLLSELTIECLPSVDLKTLKWPNTKIHGCQRTATTHMWVAENFQTREPVQNECVISLRSHKSISIYMSLHVRVSIYLTPACIFTPARGRICVHARVT